MGTHLETDSNAPRRRRYEASSQKLIKALGLDPAGLSLHTRAAMEALAEEVLALREEAVGLRQEISRAELLADRDALCPVFNRRAFERELAREIARAERFGTPLSLVYIDLDRFKQVNDQFGHQTGDNVLLRISEILAENTRETDIIGRLGGDEFGIALTHAGFADSEVKAAGLGAHIDALTVRAGTSAGADVASQEEAVRLGASCGVAEWRSGISAELLLAEADEAMFAVKAARRSRET